MRPKLRVRQFKRAVMQQMPRMLPGSPPDRRVLPRMLRNHSRNDHKEVANDANTRVAANKISLFSSMYLSL
jgi:hypothetical protein|uniref:Uncharacterized protein n=1 Tax=viral metagenome TaxID=1070528 RepID=A0A6C0LZN5_9ZZZZ